MEGWIYICAVLLVASGFEKVRDPAPTQGALGAASVRVPLAASSILGVLEIVVGLAVVLVGGRIPGLALGAAMSFQMRGQPHAALTFIGDGGSSTGAWHETINMAAVYRAPLVVVIENNQYAYSTPVYEQMVIRDIADRAAGYGIPGRVTDGNDVGNVRHVVGEALDRARHGGGPSLIELKTMRMLGHAIHDGAEYVADELLAQWERRDPVRNYATQLLEHGVDPADIEEIDRLAEDEITAAVEEAEAAPMPDPAEVAEGVYAG